MISRSIDQPDMSMEPIPLPSGLFRGPKDIMTNLRILLLATTALTVAQLATSASHAQTAPLVMAQAKEELGPDGRPKGPAEGPPPPSRTSGAPRPAAAPRRSTASRAAASATPGCSA